MAWVVPSRAVSVISNLFPNASDGCAGNFPFNAMSDLKSVLVLLNKIPEELLVLNDEDYANFLVAQTELQIASEWLIAKGHPDPEEMQPGWNYAAGRNPIDRIVKILRQCPDEYPAPSTTELLFIKDDALRESIRLDVGATYRALNNNEWKAATVLGGAAIEALLHWRLTEPQPTQTEISAAVTALKAATQFKAPTSRDDWVLAHFIPVAEKLKLIKPHTAKAADLARNFRNLIHPGAGVRMNQLCDIATAHSAIAALEHVIRDFA